MPEPQEELPRLEVPIQRRKLSADVAQWRLADAADNSNNDEVAQPRIEAMLTACKLTAQQLEEWHRRVADETDLDLTGYSRASAIWLLSGRCLGLLRALLVQVEAGICTEAIVTGRAIHEATRVLMVFDDPDEDELLRLWLDDEGKYSYVQPKAAREANDRYEQKLAEAMERSGLPRIRATKDLAEELYDRQSRVAHSRRSSVVDAVWLPGRQMAYGFHPSAIRRAGYASWAGTMTVEVTNAVGDALRAFFGPGFFANEVVPLRESVDAVRRDAKLDERSIRRDAATE